MLAFTVAFFPMPLACFTESFVRPRQHVGRNRQADLLGGF
jgi:hypothetical protein